MRNSHRFRSFIQSFTRLVEQFGGDEECIFADGKKLLSELISHDDWLPDDVAQPGLESYRQHLLYCDPVECFSVVSFVWGPGQATPVHDHTTWGIVGVMRGAEVCEEFELEPETGRLRSIGRHYVPTGGIDLVSPRVGDIHKVSNALADRASISIHVYGADIGTVKRNIYEMESGCKKTLISGYSSCVTPNIWDRSAE